MTASSLRLVVASPEGAVAPALDLPVAEGSALHVHLHLGAPATAAAPATVRAPLLRRRWWPRLLYLAGTALLVVVSYDVGTFAHHRTTYVPTSVAAAPVEPPTIPPALRAQLALPPVVTPPPAAPAPGNAFGLHP